MIPPSPIRLKPLAQLCRRLAVATGAGLEDRRIWRDEAARGGAAQRRAVGRVADGIARGQSVDDALAAAGAYFPDMFRRMVAVGEASGNLDRTYRRLAEHYENLLATRRTLRSALAWPALQLGLALATIGLVIAITSALDLKNLDGEPLDLFGLGLTGPNGLRIYVALIAAAVAAGALAVEAARRGAFSMRALETFALGLPGIGAGMRTLALARFTWALQLVLDTAMDLRQALPLALDAAGLDAYRRLAPDVTRQLSRGMSLHNALAETSQFPADLLDALAVGEQSGMLAETMQRQAAEYQQRAQSALAVAAHVVGGVVWVAVAAMIIMLIFRVYSGYVATIQSLT